MRKEIYVYHTCTITDFSGWLSQINDLAIQDGAMRLESTKPPTDPTDPYPLERSLAPMWWLSYYGGLLLDWCRPIHRGWLSTIAHCFFIVLTFTSTLYQLITKTFHLILAIHSSTIQSNNYTTQDVFLPITYVCMLPIIVLTWILFLLFRRKFLTFFLDWEKLERKTPIGIVDHVAIKRVSKITNTIYCLNNASFFCFLVYFSATMEIKPSEDIILYYFPNLLSSPLFSVIYRVSHATWGFSTMVIYLVIDMVPIFVYYHISKTVEAMVVEIKRIQAQEIKGISYRIEAMWARFEHLRQLLQRADQIVGPIIIINHGTTFFSICCSIYLIIKTSTIKKELLSSTLAESGLFNFWELLPGSIMFNTFRLLFCIFMIDKVQKQSDSLVTTTTRLSASRYRSTDKEERRIITILLNRVQSAGMIACPAGFYNITPSILLTLMSLIVTYTIILLQL